MDELEHPAQAPSGATATELLMRWRAGEEQARDQLFNLCYRELKHNARRLLYKDNLAVELRPTELLHEGALRLFQLDQINWQNRAHFLALAAKVMRQTLLDQARYLRAEKRQAPPTLTLFDANEPTSTGYDIEALHQALDNLTLTSAQHAQVVEMRFFGGMTHEQIAEVLGVSERTVKRNWRSARAWLESELQEPGK